jgi:cytochrome c peroxidase
MGRPRSGWRFTLALLGAAGCAAEPAGPDGPTSTLPVWADTLTLPASPLNYANPALPAYMLAGPIAAQRNTPAGNPVTDWGASLGRVLFYDKRLSANNTVACASCHVQARGFSDPEVLSRGFQGGHTSRHSMGLVNAAYYPNGRFFWDERAATLENQVLRPIQDPVEMGMSLDVLVPRLEAVTWYPALFERAFGTPVVTPERISRSLAQFVRSIVSYQTRFDVGRATLPPLTNLAQAVFPNYTPQEQQGKALFFDQTRGNCAACHGTETFTAPGARNNGLDLVSADPGTAAVTGNPADHGHFKVPSLRGVAERAPYMHDGRFATLEAVIDHYSTGVQNAATLSPQMRAPGGAVRRPNFTPEERAALVAFLRTLSDSVLATDQRWASPFRP